MIVLSHSFPQSPWRSKVSKTRSCIMFDGAEVYALYVLSSIIGGYCTVIIVCSLMFFFVCVCVIRFSVHR